MSNRLRNNAPFKEKYPNERFVLSIAKQYENQGLSLAELVEVGNRGLKKAEIKTQGLKNEEKKLSRMVWFIRQEIVNELARLK